MKAAMFRLVQPWPLALVLLVLCVPQLVRLCLSVTVQAPLDFNEGWNALHAQALASGLPLYPPPGDLFFNNYPPLSFHLVAWLTPTGGDHVVTGRWLSLAGLAGLGAAAGWTCRRAGCTLEASVLGGVYLVAMFLPYSHYPGINDPQLLAHAVATPGLALVLGAPRAVPALIAGAVCLAVAGFLKHSLVVAPVALCLWLAIWHGRAALWFAMAGIFSAGVLYAVFAGAHGAGFLGHLMSARAYSAAEALRGTLHWLTKTWPMLLALAWAGWRWRGDGPIMFCAIYAALAVVAGGYFKGGAGVDQNVFFDAYVACAVGLGLLASRLPRARGLLGLVFCLPLAVSVLVQSTPAWADAGHWLAPHREVANQTVRAVAELRQHAGPAVCTQMALCYWAGKGRTVDAFGYPQSVRAGSGLERTFHRRIEAREFGVIQGAERWGATARAVALRAGYVEQELPGLGRCLVRDEGQARALASSQHQGPRVAGHFQVAPPDATAIAVE